MRFAVAHECAFVRYEAHGCVARGYFFSTRIRVGCMAFVPFRFHAGRGRR